MCLNKTKTSIVKPKKKKKKKNTKKKKKKTFGGQTIAQHKRHHINTSFTRAEGFLHWSSLMTMNPPTAPTSLVAPSQSQRPDYSSNHQTTANTPNKQHADPGYFNIFACQRATLG